MMSVQQTRAPTPDDVVIKVRAIRQKYKSPYPVLAALFNLSSHAVSKICRYERRPFVNVKSGRFKVKS